MCVILHGKTKHISSLDLKKAWNTNPHGAGIVVPARQPRVIKGIMTLDRLRVVLDAIPQDHEIVVHLRQATHGSVNAKNTHPFRITDQAWLMHNGVLTGLGKQGHNGHSDSAHLAKILRKLSPKDRALLLELLPGRYAVTMGRSVELVGDFAKNDKVRMSNEYWNSDYCRVTYRSKYTHFNTNAGSSESITPRISRGSILWDGDEYLDIDDKGEEPATEPANTDDELEEIERLISESMERIIDDKTGNN